MGRCVATLDRDGGDAELGGDLPHSEPVIVEEQQDGTRCLGQGSQGIGHDPAQLPLLRLIDRGNDRLDRVPVIQRHRAACLTAPPRPCDVDHRPVKPASETLRIAQPSEGHEGRKGRLLHEVFRGIPVTGQVQCDGHCHRLVPAGQHAEPLGVGQLLHWHPLRTASWTTKLSSVTRTPAGCRCPRISSSCPAVTGIRGVAVRDHRAGHEGTADALAPISPYK
jgi:hypothetical protein